MADNASIIAALRGQDAMPFGVGGPAEPAVESGAPGLISAILGMPKELMQASANAVPGLRRQDVTDIPGSAQPNDPMYGAAANMAMNLVGTGAPAAEVGAAGIFGGKLAKTADLKALNEAKRMAADGMEAIPVLNETGWFRSPADYKWRFEIPDNKMALKYMPDVAGNRAMGSVDSLVKHDELFKAYPKLKDLKLELTRVTDPQYPTGAGLYSDARKTAYVAAPDMKTARSVAGHELQHGVQAIENFSYGADPDHFARLIEEGLRKNKDIGAGYNFNAIKDKAYDLYKKTAGEVEPRNVQTRLDMTPAQRGTLPPWYTQDVPYRDQLDWDPVKGLLTALRDRKK